MAARNVFTSDTLYTELNMPKEMALSAKHDAVFDIVHVGDTPPPGIPTGGVGGGGAGGAVPPAERFQSAFSGEYGGSGEDGGGAFGGVGAMDALRGDGNVAPGGSAIDDMIAAGMTSASSAASRPKSAVGSVRVGLRFDP